MTEQWEDDLRMEAEGLQSLITLFNVYLDEYDRIRKEYGKYFDPSLTKALNVIEYMLVVTLESYVQENEKEPVPGIVKQFDDVMDEIQVFQAGKPTKGGDQ